MDRYAIFVDVGYVYAAGGSLVLDTPNRAQIQLKHGAFVERLQALVGADFPNSGDFLRLYWYDAAPRGLAQPEHDAVSQVPGVKVRLGRLTRYGQKGVDALVLRDMMRLSAEHAICTAFLMTGDEDLRQGVIEAQDYGVKVVLLGIEPTLGQNQAETLVHEADAARVLRYEELSECFESGIGEFGVLAFDEGFDAFGIGSEFAADWLGRAGAEAVGAVLATGRIPQETDIGLIHRLLEVGDLPRTAALPDAVIAQARDGFRAALAQAMAAASETPDPAAVTAAAALAPEALPVPAPPIEPIVETAAPSSLSGDEAWSFQEGAAFGREWLNAQPQDEVRYVRGSFPYLPRDIDIELLRRLIREMGLAPGALIGDPERKAARAGFWQALGLELDLGAPRSRATFEPIAETAPFEFGRAFAIQWARLSDAKDVEQARNLISKRIGLPSDADARMLRMASERFGDPVPVEYRHRLRDGFADAIQSL